MKNPLIPLIVVSCLVSSCSERPDQVFAQAVLNLNMIHGFAGRAMEEELKHPSVKLAANGKDTVTMTRKEVVEDKLRFVEQAHAKVKKIRGTEDSRTMLQASLAVYEYVLPVLRSEYQELAALYDGGADQAKIEALSRSIHERHFRAFQEKMDAVVAAAKPYADRHGIKVDWGVSTSPGG